MLMYSCLCSGEPRQPGLCDHPAADVALAPTLALSRLRTTHRHQYYSAGEGRLPTQCHPRGLDRVQLYR